MTAASERKAILIVIYSLMAIIIIAMLCFGIFFKKAKRELSPEEIASIVSTSSCHEKLAIENIKRSGTLVYIDSIFINKSCLKEEKANDLIEKVRLAEEASY